MESEVLFQGMSHEAGRNAVVRVYADRIERQKPRSRNSFSRASQDVEMTPMRAVSSVQTKKDGLRTNVTVYASGNNIDFRFEHKEARKFRDLITQLILNPGAASASAASPPPPAAPIVHIVEVPGQAPQQHDTPASWYPDPTGRHEQRWWGGVSWMDAVTDQGRRGSDPEGVRLMDQPQPTQTIAEQLRDLASLRDSGILTDAEFEAQKARLLA